MDHRRQPLPPCSVELVGWWGGPGCRSVGLGWAMGLIPSDAPGATLTTIVFFAGVYLAAKVLLALDARLAQ